MVPFGQRQPVSRFSLGLPPPPPVPLGSRFGTSAGGGRVSRTSLVQPFVEAASAGVHEEVADSAELEAQLLRDGQLHFFGWTFVFFKDGQKCSPLQIGENQPRFLWCIASVFAGILLLSLARFKGSVWWKGNTKRENMLLSHIRTST